MQAPQKHPYRSLRRLWHRAVKTKRMTHYGVVLPTNQAVVPKTVRDGIFTAAYEANEAVMVQHAVRPDDRVLEIGTGTGFISVLCAKICGPENVFSFEANPAMEPLIRKTYEMNGIEPQLQMKAVTTDGAPLSFFAADNLVSSSKYDRSVDGAHVSVDSVAIDQVIKQLNPTVMVMDVEGAEVELLTHTDLGSVRCIIVETHPHIVGDEAINQMLDMLQQHGFSIEAHFQKNALLTRSV